MTMLECRGLNVSIDGRILVRALELAILAGDFVCVLGPNGVGKTLTLHTLAGLRPANHGEVLLGGDAIGDLDRRVVARRLGLLLQNQDDAFPVTVLEAALMGRHAHLGFWQWENGHDLALARAALADMDLARLEHRMAATLSGGERRRLALTTLLVQDPGILLLDEPLNHLDPLHKLAVLGKLAGLAKSGKTIVATLHDPALAGRYATAVLLLFGDGHWRFGPTSELLTPQYMEELYGTPFGAYSRGEQSALLPLS